MWSNGIARSHIETTERWVIVLRIEFDGEKQQELFPLFFRFWWKCFGGKLIPSLVTGDIPFRIQIDAYRKLWSEEEDEKKEK